MSHTIRISDDAYALLADEAARAGVPPDALVDTKIKETWSPKKKKLTEKKRREALKAFIGAIDTSKTKGAGTAKEAFGQVVEEKMNRSGFKANK